MLIKDLRSSKELDDKDMTGVVGGSGTPVAPLLGISDIFAPSNQFAQQTSFSQAFSGPQTNGTFQTDDDVIFAGQGAQVINTGGNHSTSSNAASVASASIPLLLQSV